MQKIKSLLEVPAIAQYLGRIGAEPRSLRSAVVKHTHGAYWTDVATINFTAEGDVKAPFDFKPTDSELAMIKEQITNYEWPRTKTLGLVYDLPEPLKGVDPDLIYEFRNTAGELVMLQHRTMITSKRGEEKRYVPYTFFEDGEWRAMEPDGMLPLWGMEHLKDHTTVFIHEGAKGARNIHRLLQERGSHPWFDELGGAAHLGWIGGAMNPGRTDWSQLQKNGVKRAYIVADNDPEGKQAIPNIARKLKKITVFSIEFDETFPAAFDLAEKWPEKFFTKTEEGTVYHGPTFRQLLNPATFATFQIANPEGKGRPITKLREEFRQMWSWVEENDVYVCKEMPDILRPAAIFNGMMAPFSHVSDTAALVKASYQGRQTRLAYRPDIAARMINDGQTSAINLHTPSQVKSLKGSTAPWLEFLSYLVPNEQERRDMSRWVATLIARPEVRMLYAMLLVSKTQGIGKSTLGERILAPLVGLHNTGFPSEREIVESNFNSWIARKRLVVVGEIYTGQSWKAYNTLKSYVTDKKLDVNEKFARPYTVDNWAHIIACSNSEKALRLEQTDRRWFLPSLAEQAWNRAHFDVFHKWLASSGLGIIKRWAHEFGDYVMVGEHAPMTAAKRHLIEESMSDAARSLINWCEGTDNESFAVPDKWVKEWLETEHRQVYESLYDIRRIMIERGWEEYKERIKVAGQLCKVMLSPAMKFGLTAADDMSPEKEREMIRTRVRKVLIGDQGAM